jgi:oxygen-independent coproporphyrinogen-3 oxidase
MSHPIPSDTRQLIERFDRPGPRYTSYPTAVEFTDAFGESDYREHLARADANADAPLSFYAHLPFCEERCLYCGCNVVITKHRDVAGHYLDDILGEVDLLAEHLPRRRRISQLHLGGGTPTYYTPGDLERFHAGVARHFSFTPDAEIGIEVDPRVTSDAHLVRLRALGFNRLSMGVQDFDPKVQHAVNRVQGYDDTRVMIERARELGWQSINVDLIYGLPFQTLDGFQRTLEQVVALRPDRVAVYGFAFVHWMKPHMKHLPSDALPGAGLRLQLIGLAVDVFGAAGYRSIGMDHFALPDDELSRAVDSRTLSRNFMGYTVQSARDMVAVGISGIGDVQGAFVQNAKKLPTYHEAIAAGRFPVERGFRLDDDDRLRRDVITRLMCNGHLDVREIERCHGIDFAAYFAPELERLTGPDSPVSHGLAAVTPDAITLSPTGRLLVRVVAMHFDRYLEGRTGDKPVFSRTV